MDAWRCRDEEGGLDAEGRLFSVLPGAPARVADGETMLARERDGGGWTGRRASRATSVDVPPGLVSRQEFRLHHDMGVGATPWHVGILTPRQAHHRATGRSGHRAPRKSGMGQQSGRPTRSGRTARRGRHDEWAARSPRSPSARALGLGIGTSRDRPMISQSGVRGGRRRPSWRACRSATARSWASEARAAAASASSASARSASRVSRAGSSPSRMRSASST